MAERPITKSKVELSMYVHAQELDRAAIPLIPALGITLAYQSAMELQCQRQP